MARGSPTSGHRINVYRVLRIRISGGRIEDTASGQVPVEARTGTAPGISPAPYPPDLQDSVYALRLVARVLLISLHSGVILGQSGSPNGQTCNVPDVLHRILIA